MDLSNFFEQGGSGVIATAARDGSVNTAIYAVPRIVGPDQVAWGMTEGRTRENLRENPNASYIHIRPGNGFRGVRLSLALDRFEGEGALLDDIRRRTREAVSPSAGDAVKYVAYFRVVETRPLI